MNTGTPEPREALREHHERHRLAGAGRARDEPVTVAVAGEQVDGLLALADQDLLHRRHLTPSSLGSNTMRNRSHTTGMRGDGARPSRSQTRPK